MLDSRGHQSRCRSFVKLFDLSVRQSYNSVALLLQVEALNTRALGSYDESLRKYRYREALDRGLATGNPLVVAALLEALVERGGLEKALSGRDQEGLEPVIRYLAK